MYKFLATRIHDGHLSWEDLKKTKSDGYVKKVKDAYIEKYGDIA